MLQEDARRQLDAEGFCIVTGALSEGDLERVRAGLDRGIEAMRRMMGSTHLAMLDPNAANVRVVNLPAIDPVFVELLVRDDALEAARAVIGDHMLVSNFTANIALPGSGSMRLHSDQALVVPPPWPRPWAVNVIWCLDDVHEANGATRYLPGSHRLQSLEDVPPDAKERAVAFEAPAGSFIVMEGRLWHTSGRNVTQAEQRRLLFAYYACDFLRPQVNWPLVLPPDVQAAMAGATRDLFGLGPMGNTRLGAELTRLQPVG